MDKQQPLESQIDNKRIEIKRIEIEIAKTEEHILMILRDISQDKRSLGCMCKDKDDPYKIEHAQYSITRNYCDVEKYQVDVRHHKKRLVKAEQELSDLYVSLKRLSYA